jgi:putative RNA 2'-phosphotransferase
MEFNQMAKDKSARTSKFLSLILWYDPSAAGIALDSAGWKSVDDLLAGMKRAGTEVTLSELEAIVDSDSKSRSAIADGRIKANQGHSIEVDLGLFALTPPAELFHGTATRFLESILETGLKPGSRKHVHLSATYEKAVTVGRRHGKPVVLRVNTVAMASDGGLFYCSENNVWLAESVAPQFLELATTGTEILAESTGAGLPDNEGC